MYLKPVIDERVFQLEDLKELASSDRWAVYDHADTQGLCVSQVSKTRRQGQRYDCMMRSQSYTMSYIQAAVFRNVDPTWHALFYSGVSLLL